MLRTASGKILPENNPATVTVASVRKTVHCLSDFRPGAHILSREINNFARNRKH